MVHDLDDETTMEEEELLADKEEFNEDELSELQKVNLLKLALCPSHKSCNVIHHPLFCNMEWSNCVGWLNDGKPQNIMFKLYSFNFLTLTFPHDLIYWNNFNVSVVVMLQFYFGAK